MPLTQDGFTSLALYLLPFIRSRSSLRFLMKLKRLLHDSREYIASDDKPRAVKPHLNGRVVTEEGEAKEEDFVKLIYRTNLQSKIFDWMYDITCLNRDKSSVFWQKISYSLLFFCIFAVIYSGICCVFIDYCPRCVSSR